MSVKKQAPILARNKKKDNEVNKKAIIWTASIVGAIVVLVSVLIIVNG